MKSGLAGTGSEKGWQVDLDEMIGRDLYRVTITSPRYWLQVGGVPLARVSSLREFLSRSESNEKFHLHDTFGGALELIRDEGRLALRISQGSGELGTNLVEITLEPEERSALVRALEQAIHEVEQ